MKQQLVKRKFGAPEIREEQIEIGDQVYFLREMTGTERDAHNQFVSSLTQFDANGKPIRLKSFEGINSDLISRCLLDAKRVPVSKDVLKHWPATLLEELHEACRVVNGMVSKEEKSGNDSEGSAGSGSN